MGRKDYYTVLGVTPTESPYAIRNAYRTLAKQYHPDYAGTEGHAPFQEIQEAYEVLSDPLQRKAYDASRADRRKGERTHGRAPEPLVPRPPQSWHVSPEPLVTPTASPEVFFASPSVTSCQYRHGHQHEFEPPCPICQEGDPLAEDVARVFKQWLNVFRVP